MGPIRDFFLARLVLRFGAGALSACYEPDSAACAAIDAFLDSRLMIGKAAVSLFSQLPASGHAALQRQMAVDPDGEHLMSLLSAAPATFSGLMAAIDPDEHPLLAWLTTPEGLAFMWAVLSAILSIWHIPLPPLPTPPIPPAPAPHA